MVSFVNSSWTTEHIGAHVKSGRSHCEETKAPRKDLWDNLCIISCEEILKKLWRNIGVQKLVYRVFSEILENVKILQ